MNHPGIAQNGVTRIPAERLKHCFLQFNPEKLDQCGIDTRDLSRTYPKGEPRQTAEQWAASLDETIGDSPFYLQTFRNAVQNTGCPAYDTHYGVIQSDIENVQQHRRTYSGLAVMEDGRVEFKSLDLSRPVQSDIVRFISGIRVLDQGEVLCIEEMLPDIADISHAVQLNLFNGTLPNADEQLRFQRFQELYNEIRHGASGDEIAEKLLDAARGNQDEPPLLRTNSYLHNFCGTDKNGGLVLVTATGTLEEVAQIAKDAGAVSGAVVDNGGSVTHRYGKEGLKSARTLFESHYYRELCTAVAIYVMHPGRESTFLSLPQQCPDRTPARHCTTRVHFETDHGITSQDTGAVHLDREDAINVAIQIGNFSMIIGASSAWVEAPESFVKHVRSCYRERYRATKRSEDPTTLRGCWMEYYVESIYEKPFQIRTGKPAGYSTAPLARAYKPNAMITNSSSSADSAVIGLDCGGSHIKSVLVRGDDVYVGKNFDTRPKDNSSYNTDFLKDQLRAAVGEVCKMAGIQKTDISGFGVSWAGAVRNQKVAPSKILLGLTDLWNSDGLIPARLQDVQDLGNWIRNALAVQSDVPITVFNDGEVEVLGYERDNVLMVKLGTTIAGAYRDSTGNTNYLTELGRVVITRDENAPRHPASLIQGTANQLIGSSALARACREHRLFATDGAEIELNTAGHQVSELLDSGNEVATEIVREMGRHLTTLILEVHSHLPDIKSIILCGGLTKGTTGTLIREEVLRQLPDDISNRIDNSQPEQESGAIAAAKLVRRLRYSA